MRKTYHRLLRENQELRKQIIQLENLIDIKDKKYWKYVHVAQDNIERLENIIIEKGGA